MTTLNKDTKHDEAKILHNEREDDGESPIPSSNNTSRSKELLRKLYGHHTIESARKELLEAKQRVFDLESIIKDIEGGDKVTTCHEAMQGQTLRLALEFLRIEDVVSCSQVCQRWSNDINTPPSMWKKALEKNGWGRVVQHMENRFHSSTQKQSSPEQQNQPLSSTTSSKKRPSLPPDYYKNLALDTLRDTKPTSKDKDRVRGYKSKLNPEDILLVVEVKDKRSGDILFVFNRSLEQDYQRAYKFSRKDMCSPHLPSNKIYDGNDMLLPATLEEGTFNDHFNNYSRYLPERRDTRNWNREERPYPFNNMAEIRDFYQRDNEIAENSSLDYLSLDTPNDFVPWEIHESISFSVRCVRCDTGQSMNWDFGQGEGRERHSRVDKDSFKLNYGEFTSYAKTPHAMTESGIVARDVWSTEGYKIVHVGVSYVIKSVYPENEDNLNNESWRQTRYRLDAVCCGFLLDYGPQYEWGMDNPFKNMQELMLSLEGLEWR